MSEFFHVFIASDSLSLPRPWNQKNLEDQPEQFFRMQETYPLLLDGLLKRIQPDRRNVVTTQARRGGTIQYVDKTAQEIFSWMSADVVVLHYGVVDCWLHEGKEQSTPAPQFEAAVAKILAAWRNYAPQSRLVVLGIFPTNARMLGKNDKQNAVIAEYNAILRTAAAKDGAIFIDVEALAPEIQTQAVHEDGHHLSRYGHDLLARLIARRIAESLDLPLPLEDARAEGDVQNAVKELDLLVKSKDLEALARAAARLERTDGAHPEVRKALAAAYAALGEHRRAFLSHALLAQESPFNAAAAMRAAIAAFAALPPEEALPYLQKAYALNPSNRSGVFRLMRTLGALKEYRTLLAVGDIFLAREEDEQIRSMQETVQKRVPKSAAAAR